MILFSFECLKNTIYVSIA